MTKIGPKGHQGHILRASSVAALAPWRRMMVRAPSLAHWCIFSSLVSRPVGDSFIPSDLPPH